MEKVCFKCHRSLALRHFYRHKAMADGRLNKCKECTRRDVAENRLKRIDKIREYDRARGFRISRAAADAWKSERPGG